MAIFFIVLFITVFEDLMVAIAVGGILAVIGSFNHIRGTISKHNSYKIIPFKKSDIQIDQTISESLNSSSTYVIQPIGTIFFGTIEPLLENYSKQPNHETLIIDMQYVKHADLTGAFAIEDLCKVCKMKDIKAFIVNEKGPIQNLLSDLNISKAFRPEMQTKHL
jgi:SulP family sulfate permease